MNNNIKLSAVIVQVYDFQCGIHPRSRWVLEPIKAIILILKF